ncbi:MAG: hypothetical protein IKZ42_01645 [Clostridiales bacterium]|nr:hypothetical protein [Clostridiales bacterium]
MALFMMGIGHEMMFLGISHFKTLPSFVLKFFIYGQMFAPPVFFFFISEGFRYTRSRKKYALRLLVFTLITQIPYYLCSFREAPWWSIFTHWSVLASLFAGLMVLMVWERGWKLPLKILAMIGIAGATVLIKAEWMFFGPLVIFLFYVFREKPVLRLVSFELAMLVHLYFSNGFTFYFAFGGWAYFIAETIAMLVITFFYNGRKGHFPTFSKWVFYVFYPLHLLIPYILKAFFNF